MADATIDSLQIEINAKAQKANDAIDVLVDKLDVLSNSLGKLNGAKITNFAESVNWLTSSLRNAAGIDGRTFTALQKNITKLANINPATLSYSATSISDMATSLDKIASSANSLEGVKAFASAISKLGNKNVATATANIPQLATALNRLMVTLSKAPTVNKSVIDMTNALANLAAQGSKVGSASKSVVNGLNRTNAAAKRTAGSTMSLARAFGKFYTSYFLLVRGFKGMFNMMKSAMELTETVNYFEVTLNNIGQNAKDSWKEYGYESADAYADSFAERLRESNEKLTGFAVSETGQISQSVFSGLGISPATATQYSAMFAQVANSIGMTEEASIALSEAFVRLGADWASLRNVDFTTAYEKLASGLSGQSRALRAFGIDITMATLQEIAFANGIEKSVSEMTQSEKSYLRLIAIIEQSEVAFGDLANTLASPSNQMRMLSQGIQNLGTLIGNLFLPILSKTLPVLNGFVIAMQRIVIAISEAMGIDTSGFNTSLGGMDESFGDLSDSVDEATESAEKFNRATRGWDELNVLGKDTSKGYGVGNGLVENEELLTAYDKAIEKYRKAWEEAYEKINNEAEDFADKLLHTLNVEKIVDNFKDLAESVKNISDALLPLLSGIALGFSETTFGAFKALADFAGDITENADPATMKAVGEAIGSIIYAVLLYKGVSTTTTKFVSGIKAIGTALAAHPILSTFVLATGILSLVDAWNEIGKGNVDLSEIIDDTDELAKNTQKVAENLAKYPSEMKNIDSGGELKRVYDQWKELNDITGELTDEQKGKLKLYADQIIKLCPQADKYIDENGKSYQGVADNIQKAIDNQVALYKLQAAGELLVSVEADYEMSKANVEGFKKSLEKIKEEFREAAPLLTDKEIDNMLSSYYDAYIKAGEKTAEYALRIGSKSAGYMQIDRSVSGNWADELLQDPFGLKAQEKQNELEEIAKEYAETYKKFILSSNVFEETEKKFNEMSEWYNKIRESAEKANATIGKTSPTVEELGKQLGISERYTKSLKEEVNKLDDAFGSAKSKADKLADAVRKLGGIKFERRNAIYAGFKLPQYANGGFPEDGLFMANHSELVGKFSNGKTAVANNNQIASGIEDAAYRGMMRALQNADMGSKATFEVVGDPNGMFRVIQKQANQYTKSTGRNAFGY